MTEIKRPELPPCWRDLPPESEDDWGTIEFTEPESLATTGHAIYYAEPKQRVDAVADTWRRHGQDPWVAYADALEAERDAWRMKCPVNAEQVEAAGLAVAMFKRWCERGDARIATRIARDLAFGHPQGEPTPTWWASTINAYTSSTADAQRLLDELAEAGRG